MRRKGPAVEYGIAIAVFLAVLAFTLATQERIAANGGRGYDGALYYQLAAQLAAGEGPAGTSRFASRLGTPLLAAMVNGRDLIAGFQAVNLMAAFASTLLFLAWLRRYLDTPWLRVVLVVVYVSHWLQLVRFTVFYPVLTDAWPQMLCLAGLNAIASYERAPSAAKIAVIAAISGAGVVFREVVLLVPIAFLFASRPGVAPRPRWPSLGLTGGLRSEQWIPLAVAVAAFAAIGRAVQATDAGFSAPAHLLEGALSRSALSYLLGWMVAFGPGLFLVLFDWRFAAGFVGRHTWMLVYLAGVAGAGWAGSLESERHALNWGAPILYLLIGLTLERHRQWLTGAVAVVLLVSQALVNRLFWTIPQPADDYLQRTPAIVLTPLGPEATYLHLFPDYLPRPLAWLQFWQFLVLGAVIAALAAWRAFDPGAELPVGSRMRGALARARASALAVAGGTAAHLRHLGARGVLAVLATFLVVSAAAGAGLVSAYRAQPVRINVRWKAHVGEAERQRVERQLSLTRGALSEGTTWEYMTEGSPDRIRAIVRHPAVEDTAHVDRDLFRPEAADQREQRASLFGVLIGLAAALGVGAFRVAGPRPRERRRSPPSHRSEEPQ